MKKILKSQYYKNGALLNAMVTINVKNPFAAPNSRGIQISLARIAADIEGMAKKYPQIEKMLENAPAEIKVAKKDTKDTKDIKGK